MFEKTNLYLHSDFEFIKLYIKLELIYLKQVELLYKLYK
jgi:hypothetical protein